MEASATKPLRKQDVKFKWTKEVELFVVQQYAEFTNAIEICQSVIQLFSQYCEEDIDKYGEDRFAAYLMRRIYDLTPTNKRFPQQYQDAYNSFRKDYLNDISSCYLSHRRNRMRELDALYLATRMRLQTEDDNTEFRQGVQTAKDLLKEARNEMDKSKITVEASIEEGAARVVAKQELETLPDDELKKILEAHESGKSIKLPSETTSDGSDTLSDGSGDPTESEE